jgi:hypothetical protein
MIPTITAIANPDRTNSRCSPDLASCETLRLSEPILLYEVIGFRVEMETESYVVESDEEYTHGLGDSVDMEWRC